MIDYLIVGSGLAGISFAEVALQNNKTIHVIDTDLQNSSKIAGGLYNPVILKRFSKLWQAEEQIEQLNKFYSKVESKLETQFDYKMPILRKFFSIEEQNNWFIASDKEGLSPFLSTKLINKKYDCIDSPYDYGEVMKTGYVDVALLLEKYKEYLIKIKAFTNEPFEYQIIDIKKKHVEYKEIKARHIVFAEGYGMHSNPYFKNLPLDGTKGELFIIKAPNLNLDVIINTSVFILPLGNNLFKVGATYNWEDKTNIPTEEGKKELTARIKEIITCDFEIISHLAGVRPTVKDRKPLVGTHSEHKSLHLLNGLGTRGVLIGPSMAKALFEYIEYDKILDSTINIDRFKKAKR
jgi:glycine/D-amino acid oxidase-like deaminating enzyme